jgi:hypothetical protein
VDQLADQPAEIPAAKTAEPDDEPKVSASVDVADEQPAEGDAETTT